MALSQQLKENWEKINWPIKYQKQISSENLVIQKN